MAALHPIIKQLIGNRHVAESNLRVIRHVVSCMAPGAWRKLTRAKRKGILRGIIREHARNFATYAYVMGGR